MKEPGECKGQCDICPMPSDPDQLEFDFAGLIRHIQEEIQQEEDDKIVRPSHYTQWAIQPLTYIQRNKMEFWRGNIIKYASRAGAKVYDGMDLNESEITDLEKVRRYAEIRINEIKGEMEL